MLIICKQATESHFKSLTEAETNINAEGTAANSRHLRDIKASLLTQQQANQDYPSSNLPAMPSPGTLAAVLLLLALTIASPTTTLEAEDSHHLVRQVATATSLTLPSIPTITIDILQPPYVSLHSITARDAQTPEPTTATTTTSKLGSIVPVWTVTLRSHHEPKLITYGFQTTSISSALHHWSEVPVASSASSFTQAVDINQTESDCTAICGALNADGECSKVTHCFEMEDGKVKGGNPQRANGAGSGRLNGRIAVRAVAVVVLVVGVWMML